MVVGVGVAVEPVVTGVVVAKTTLKVLRVDELPVVVESGIERMIDEATVPLQKVL
jgi:hypothetical protein